MSGALVAGVHGEVAAACGLGCVAGALHAGGADPVGLGGAPGEFGADRQRGLQRQRGQGLQDQVGDGGVDAGSAGRLAWWAAGGDPFTLAGIVRNQGAVPASVVAHGHPLAAFAAEDQALEQGGAFPCWAGFAVLAVGGGVADQGGLVGLELFPADVAGVSTRDQGGPVLPGFDQGAVMALSLIHISEPTRRTPISYA